ncbi:putative zinc-binding protein [Clostridium sp.]|uniref:putative zinc-binding protein n=1 Tax=Clostridium sp. TaxID=1506 RepID=UPI0026233B09|nr:putative zinc-binding protein [Clostridium sp.]
MYEEIKIEKVEEYCGLCEDYAKKNLTNPTKIAIISCEGACARGEVSRRAANLISHKIAKENTVRICLGGAFTKEGGQRNLVREAHKAIAIEGCFINCSSRMMKGVIPELEPLVVQADKIYSKDLPFGIDEVTDEEFNECAKMVAEEIVEKYIYGDSVPEISSEECSSNSNIGCCSANNDSKSSCCK